MLNIVVVGSDDIRLRLMQQAVVQLEKILPVRAFDRYPPAVELIRVIDTLSTEVILLDLDDREHALRLATAVHSERPQTPIVGVASNSEEYFDVSRTGVVITLSYPLMPSEVLGAIQTALHATNSIRQPKLFVFLPSKAGSGCSAVTLNTAAAMSNLGKRVLLVEADLRSGALSVVLNHKPSGSIQDVLASIPEIDSFKWDRAITRLHGFDMLLSNRTAPKRLPDWTDYYSLIQFAAPRYDALLVDLPELVNPGTAELVRTARKVFLVCTQEILSLKLAEQRGLELAAWGVPTDSVGILINRWQNQELSRDDVERLLNHPVAAVFPNDYSGLRDSLLAGKPVIQSSKLGKAFKQFAGQLQKDGPVGTPPVLRGFRDLIRSFSES